MNGGRQRLIGSITATVDLTAIGGFSDTIRSLCSVQPSPALAPKCSVPNSANPGTYRGGHGVQLATKKEKKMQWGFPLVLGGLRS